MLSLVKTPLRLKNQTNRSHRQIPQAARNQQKRSLDTENKQPLREFESVPLGFDSVAQSSNWARGWRENSRVPNLLS
jgi:hypothetical protein